MADKFIGKRVACIHCRQPFEVEVMPGAGAAPDPLPPAPSLNDLPPGPVRAPPACRGAPGPAPAAAGRPAGPRAGAPAAAPPRPRPVGAGLRVGPLVVSLLSLAVTGGSLAGIVSLLRPAPPPEVPPDLWAAVAIESGGVRLVVVDARRNPGYTSFYPLRADTAKWGLFSSKPAALPDAPPADELGALERILADYKREMDERGVPPGQRRAACNGGALRVLKDEPKGEPEEAKQPGGEGARVAPGAGPEGVRSDLVRGQRGKEAEYGARGCMPYAWETRRQAVCLDIGGRSTKYGYFDQPVNFRPGRLGFGAETSEAEINKRRGATAFPLAAERWRADVAAEANKPDEVLNHLRGASSYYLLGGTPWAVAVLTHPESFVPAPNDREANVRLKPADAEAARKLLTAHPNFAAIEARRPRGPGRAGQGARAPERGAG
jgi:hypothetical protein